MSSRVRWAVSLILGLLLVVVAAPPGAVAAPVPDGGKITPGTPFTVALAAAGASNGVSVKVDVRAGQRILMAETPFLATPLSVDVRDGAGNPLPSAPLSSAYNELLVAPTTGTYTLHLLAYTSTAVTVSLRVDLVTDTTSALTVGTPAVVRTTRGQNANLTFPATAGQKLDVDLTAVALTGSAPAVHATLVQPDGTLYDLPPTGGDEPFDFSAEIARTGTWKLIVDPAGDSAGSVTVAVRRVTDTVVPVTSDKAVAVTFPGHGRDVRLTFAGQVGQRVTLGVTASSITAPPGYSPTVRARLIGPDGVERGDLGDVITGTTFLDDTQHTLDQAGTWTVLLDATDATSGSLTVEPGLVTDVNGGTLTLGTAKAITYSTPGQRITYSFAATAGKKLLFEQTAPDVTAGGRGGNAGLNYLTATLYGPDGAAVASYFGTNDTFGELYSPVTGTYKVVVSGYGDSVGTTTLTVRNPSVAGAALPLNTSTTARISQGNAARYTFTGVAGSRLTLQFTQQAVNIDPYFATTQILIYQPDGSLFSTDEISAYPDWHDFFSESAPLPSAGAWSVVVDPEVNTAGSFTFTPRLTADQKATLTPGTEVTTRISLPGQQARYTFAGVKGRRVTLDSTAVTWVNSLNPTQSKPVDLTLVRPDGSVVTDAFWPVPPYNAAGATFQELNRLDGLLDATGTWTLVVDPFYDVVGSQTFTLGLVPDLTGTTTRGTAKKVTLGTRGQRGRYTFSWNGKGSLPWSVTGAAFPGSLTIVSPDGSWVQSGSFATGNTSGQSLPGDSENGTWTAVVDADGIGTGAVTFRLG